MFAAVGTRVFGIVKKRLRTDVIGSTQIGILAKLVGTARERKIMRNNRPTTSSLIALALIFGFCVLNAKEAHATLNASQKALVVQQVKSGKTDILNRLRVNGLSLDDANIDTDALIKMIKRGDTSALSDSRLTLASQSSPPQNGSTKNGIDRVKQVASSIYGGDPITCGDQECQTRTITLGSRSCFADCSILTPVNKKTPAGTVICHEEIPIGGDGVLLRGCYGSSSYRNFEVLPDGTTIDLPSNAGGGSGDGGGSTPFCNSNAECGLGSFCSQANHGMCTPLNDPAYNQCRSDSDCGGVADGGNSLRQCIAGSCQ